MIYAPFMPKLHKMGSSIIEAATPHVILFPFMSKGHIIPLVHLSELLHRRNVKVTFITTPGNSQFVSDALSYAATTTNIIELPFPENIPDIPAGTESTDQLTSQTLLASFTNGTKLMQPHFETALRNLLPVTFIVSDGFLGWTLESASKFNIPRFTIFGTNQYTFSLGKDINENNLFEKIKSDDEPFTLPSFPWITITKSDYDRRVRDETLQSANSEFISDIHTSTAKSHGLLVNSFYEMESKFVDYWNIKSEAKAYCIGPLCLAAKSTHSPKPEKATYMQWLDIKLKEAKQVLYVAFGSQAEMSAAQFKEIELALERSSVNFLWAMKEKKGCYELDTGFESRVQDRGLVVKTWVNQVEILNHECVKGFLSHCGWNSCLESICACVPILAFPLMNDQHLNTKFVVEEIKVGLRVETVDGSVRGYVKAEGLAKTIRELMEGDMGVFATKNVVEVGKMAKLAMEKDGSSWLTLNEVIDELCSEESTRSNKGMMNDNV